MDQELGNNDAFEGGSASSEISREQSEKYQEKTKKTQAQLRRIQKDEKKAQGDNDRLFYILMRFIQDPYYESLIPTITKLLDINTPSRAIIALIALFYPDAAYYVAQVTGNREKFDQLLALHRYESETPFDDKEIDMSIRNWVTTWITLIEQFLIDENEGSLLMMKKTLDYLETEHVNDMQETITDFFLFFFRTRNILMEHSTSEAYARFIQKNLIQSLRVRIELLRNAESGSNELTVELMKLLEENHLSIEQLFGLGK